MSIFKGGFKVSQVRRESYLHVLLNLLLLVSQLPKGVDDQTCGRLGSSEQSGSTSGSALTGSKYLP